jgi:Mg2+ and Co2+ transporter CorA
MIFTQAFNLITQHDNRIIQRDSTSMKTIAVLTLVFLPTTAIATIFGTQFFDFGETGELHVSRWIWGFALVSVLVTVAVCVAWIHRDWKVKRRLLGKSLSLNPLRVNMFSG